ncbi:ABC transporter substrate-binding protein [Motilimonas eburnea]|uniref:ABC transporter substrate-binding protein n=1 Tax=Motilimonas eburnea TaxID=1737488 RepID=UPI001E2F5582|nr:ABC transporter substrate-binding protein [Motilimonas eburnea]MCE2571362.1 ABC transporter substrate-binding protein [Motilimonas eburnea]
MKLLMALSSCLLLMQMSTAMAAPQYIQPKALEQIVKTSAKPVQDQNLSLPIITWGGDITTIYANGSDKQTQTGSLFHSYGLDFQLTRNDDFTKQLELYLSGKTPYLRGTLGMINAATDLLNKQPNTAPVIIHQLTWSSGGDALVVKQGINTVADLKGKTIALQAYGPHVDYMMTLLSDAKLKPSDVKIKWLPDLTGTDNSPMAALYESDIDAAFVIIPDALALTSGGNVGTGAEDSIKNARILMSTKTANRVITDVYAVRSDYYQQHRNKVESFVKALYSASSEVKKLFNHPGSDQARYNQLLRTSAQLLLDSADAVADTQGLYLDAEHLDINSNMQFFTDQAYPRNANKMNHQIQPMLKHLALSKGSKMPTLADWDFVALGGDVSFSQKSRFNSAKVANVVAKKQQQSALSDGELFSFEVAFTPNQNAFDGALYAAEFNRVIELASTYGGAVITVEGHSDPLKYLRSKKQGESGAVLARLKQSNKNISLSRAQSVQEGLIEFAQQQGITLDSNQFALVGHGFSQPQTGMCGSDPCAPKTEAEWRSNMRVVFRIIQLEAEADVFQPL